MSFVPLQMARLPKGIAKISMPEPQRTMATPQWLYETRISKQAHPWWEWHKSERQTQVTKQDRWKVGKNTEQCRQLGTPKRYWTQLVELNVQSTNGLLGTSDDWDDQNLRQQTTRKISNKFEQPTSAQRLLSYLSLFKQWQTISTGNSGPSYEGSPFQKRCTENKNSKNLWEKGREKKSLYMDGSLADPRPWEWDSKQSKQIKTLKTLLFFQLLPKSVLFSLTMWRTRKKKSMKSKHLTMAIMIQTVSSGFL